MEELAFYERSLKIWHRCCLFPPSQAAVSLRRLRNPDATKVDYFNYFDVAKVVLSYFIIPNISALPGLLLVLLGWFHPLEPGQPHVSNPPVHPGSPPSLPKTFYPGFIP